MTKNVSFTLIWFVALSVIGMSYERASTGVDMVSLDGRQIGDTIYLFVNWHAADPPGTQQVATAGYEVRIVEMAGIDTVASNSVGIQLSDTLTIDFPLLGDSITVYAAVATRDVEGDLSEVWSLSNRLRIHSEKRPPNPPGPVTIDTIPEIAAILVRPKQASLVPMEVLQMCAFAVLVTGEVLKVQNSWNIPACQAWLQIVRQERATIKI